ncbi:MAG: septum formation initiator family protein [Lachnospiraceae bacterium]
MAIKREVKKKRPKRLLGIVILAVSVFFLCTSLYLKKVELQKEYEALNQEKKRLEILIAEEEKRSAEIDEYRAYVQTKSYMEDVARDVLGLVYGNEVIFRVNPEK